MHNDLEDLLMEFFSHFKNNIEVLDEDETEDTEYMYMRIAMGKGRELEDLSLEISDILDQDDKICIS